MNLSIAKFSDCHYTQYLIVLFMQLYKTLQYVVKHKFEKDVNAIKNLKLLDIFQNGHKLIQDPTTRENEVKIVNLYKI